LAVSYIISSYWKEIHMCGLRKRRVILTLDQAPLLTSQLHDLIDLNERVRYARETGRLVVLDPGNRRLLGHTHNLRKEDFHTIICNYLSCGYKVQIKPLLN